MHIKSLYTERVIFNFLIWSSIQSEYSLDPVYFQSVAVLCITESGVSLENINKTRNIYFTKKNDLGKESFYMSFKKKYDPW